MEGTTFAPQSQTEDEDEERSIEVEEKIKIQTQVNHSSKNLSFACGAKS